MADFTNSHLLLFEDKYKKLKPRNDARIEMSSEQMVDNIQQEGFFELPGCNDARFISGVYDIMLDDYAAVSYQESELSQMWRVFRTLYNNGIKPNDDLSRKLYLMLAKETVIVSDLLKKSIVSRLGVRDKADLIVTGLNSFDTSKYFFRTLKVLEKEEQFNHNHYNFYYSEFISTIADLCPTEELLYSIIAERVATPTESGRQSDREREIMMSGREIAEFLMHEGHSTSREEKGNMFGKTSKDIIETHDNLTDNRIINFERETMGRVPQYIKIPSLRRHMKY